MSSNGSSNRPRLAETSAPRSDREYLEREAQQARNAMHGTLAGMKNTISGALELDRAADGHPWMTVGAAAAVGLVAGGLVAVRHPHRPQPQPAEPMHLVIQFPRLDVSVPAAEEAGATVEKDSWGSQLTAYLGTLITPPLADILKAFAKDFVTQHITTRAPASTPGPLPVVALALEPPVSVDSMGHAEPQTPEEAGSGA